ncbi:hypothetical protein QGM71_02565 [Virgibacillus sp. C22-A2]|uniref:Fur-regulated basic protein FbpA n=1 Tax=Virgibacillus tibetensis TaxID=3042313 RepID=A0ABU6KBA0_9BACI|nr:hypothetical protein [Virgibacillus sp. C22-A2]
MFKAVDTLEISKENHIIEQLHKLGFYKTNGLSYKELVHKLAVEKSGRE